MLSYVYIQNGQKAFPQSNRSLPPQPGHQNCNFYYPFSDGRRTQVLSQKRPHRSFPSSVQWLTVPRQELTGVASVSPVTSRPSGQLGGNWKNLPNMPGAARKNRTFPNLEDEWDARKGRSKYRPWHSEAPKVMARETATLGLSCPGRAGTRRVSRPRLCISTRSHCELGPITLGYSPNSGYPRIPCLPSIRPRAVHFLYFRLLRHRVPRRYRRCRRRRRHREPVSQQPSCPRAAEPDGIEEAGR